MPGAPSRETFDSTKDYQSVLHVGGNGRRLFDAELNELQSIRDWQEGTLADTVMGRNTRNLNEGHRVGQAGFVTPSGNPGTVNIRRGFYVAGGRVLTTGDPSVVDEVAVFAGGDPAGTNAVVYLSAAIDTIDSTVDPNIIDPTYLVETAHRTRRQVTVNVQTGTTSLPSPPAGSTFILLAVCTKDNDPLLAGDISEGPVIASLDEINDNLFGLDLSGRLTTAEGAIDGHSGNIITINAEQGVQDGLIAGNAADIGINAAAIIANGGRIGDIEALQNANFIHFSRVVASQIIPHDTQTPIEWDTVVESNGSWGVDFGTTPESVQTPLEGTYLQIYRVLFTGHPNATERLVFAPDGLGGYVNMLSSQSINQSFSGVAVSLTVGAAAPIGRVMVYQKSGGNLNVIGVTSTYCILIRLF